MWSQVSEQSLEKSPSSSFCGRKGQDWIIKLREQSSILIDFHMRDETGEDRPCQSETAWGASSRNYCQIFAMMRLSDRSQVWGLRSISSIKTKIKLHFLPADVEFNTFQSKQFNSIFAHLQIFTFSPCNNTALNNNASRRWNWNWERISLEARGAGGAGNFSLIIVYLGWARLFTWPQLESFTVHLAHYIESTHT